MSLDASSQGPTLVAACANCASWQDVKVDAYPGHRTTIPVNGVCTRSLTPPEGEPRCESYKASAAFERLIISRIMQDPVALPIPLPGKAAKDARKSARGRR